LSFTYALTEFKDNNDVLVQFPNKKERKMETITQVQAQKLSVLLSFKNNAEQRPKGNFV
jgi:hypothetical protein